uniref:Uncharacterized protein n=1 Tax=Opuntia streptacantha TaxID=393608 RepID=A0A7C8YFU9_OPUST
MATNFKSRLVCVFNILVAEMTLINIVEGASRSGTSPILSASPAVLPFPTTPSPKGNISSFFPPASPTDSFNPFGLSPLPSPTSGDTVGRSSSSATHSAKLRSFCFGLLHQLLLFVLVCVFCPLIEFL